MNKSKVTKQQSSKSKKKNDEAEVFVLPPNLLEQLGINLGSIETTSESTRNCQEPDKDCLPKETADQYNSTFSPNGTENHFNTALEKESSIIQTANLMKESVFLSPTFISNSTSNTEGDFEVVENNYADKAIHKINEYNFGNCEETEEAFFVLPETEMSNTDYQNNSSAYASVSAQDAIKNEHNTEDHKHNSIKETLYDEHADEAYSSDCSNSNIDKVDVLNSSSLYEIKQNINKKINIISEEIIDPSQFKNTNKCSKGNDLIPVTINAVITSQYKNSISYKNNAIISHNLITNCLKPTEMFDGINTNFHTEVDNSLNANETVTEEIESNESNNVTSTKNICIQKQNVLSHDNVSLALSTHEMQRNDDGVHLCAADNVEQSKSAEQDVFVEIYNKSTAAEYVFEADKVNDSLEKHNEISSYENSNNIAYSLSEEVSNKHEKNLTSVEYHIEEGTQKYGGEVVPAEDKLINRCGSNDSRYIKKSKEINLNVDKEDPRLQYTKSSNNHISTKIIIQSNTNIKNLVNVSTNNYKGKCTKTENNVDKEDLKVNNRISSSHDIISTESILDKNINTKIQLQEYNTDKYNSQCSKLQNNVDKNSSDVMSTETIMNENTNIEIQVEKCKDKYKKRCSTIQKNDLYFQNDISTSDFTSTESIVSKNTNDKIQRHICTDEFESQCSTMQKNVDNHDLKLSNNERNSSDIMSSQSISKENTNTEIQVEKCTDKRKWSEIQRNMHLRDLNFKSSSSDVRSTRSAFNKNTHTKIQVKKCDDKYNRQINKKQKTCDHNASKILSSENDTFRDEERERTPIKSDRIENAAAADVKMEKVKEIAKYLSQYAQIQNRNNCNVPYVGISTNNKHAAKLKLCIQGVEKPGGSLKKKSCEKYKDLRTYERKNKRILVVKSISNSCEYLNISTQKINFSDENKSNTCTENKRCLCRDFGQLISYDIQNTHENICSQNKNEKICTPDVIFSIYYEDLFSATSCDGELNECSVEEEYIAYDLKKITSYNDNGPIYTVKGSKTNTSNSEQISKEAPKRTLSLKFGDSGEPSAKKRRNSHSEIAKEHNETKEGGYVFENSRTIHDDTSSEHVSEVEPGIEGTLIVPDTGTNEATPFYSDFIKCGVCEESMQSQDWICHIASKHNYLAWKYGESTLDFNKEKIVREHLSALMREIGELKCTKCGLVRKFAKSYFKHVQRCDGFKEFHNASAFDTSTDTVSNTESIRNTRMVVGKDSVTIESVPVSREVISCGVCQESMCCSDWQFHIESQHQYMAWKSGEPDLDVNNEEAVRKHLYDLTREFGGLKCAKCGVIRKYVKSYLFHIQDCSGLNESLNTDTFVNATNTDIKIRHVKSELIKCGVCQESMHIRDWQSHIESQHNYLAWEFGDPALDLNNEDAVREHLYCLSKELGGLKCAKCGVTRKYVKSYLTHIEDCNGLNDSLDTSALDTSSDIVTGLVGKAGTSGNDNVKTEAASLKTDIICGVCQQSMRRRDWQFHIESAHHYMAWQTGEPVLDVNDEKAVRKHLYDLLKEFGGLRCTKCGIVRKYVKPFLSHIQSCNGPSESQNKSSLNDVSGIVSGSDSTIVDTLGASCDKNEVRDAGDELVKCGVCDESVKGSDWLHHIESRHDYLAWKHDEPILDVNSIEEVHEHLYNITKEYGALKCSKCGLARKYVKSYMTHIRNCSGPKESRNDSEFNTSSFGIEKESTIRVGNVATNPGESGPETQSVTCGVCKEPTRAEDWILHIRTQHDYLAWKVGEPALNVNDEEAVREHLHDISKDYDGLQCSKCGVIRRYVKCYLAHFNGCSESNRKERGSDPNSPKCDVLLDIESSSSNLAEALVKCGVCGQYMLPKNWMAHIAEKHNYLAWKAGDLPLDIKDKVEVRRYLQEHVEKYGPLTCSKCGLRCKYVKNYMRHISTCHDSENSLSDSPLSADMDSSEISTVEVITSTSGTEQIKCGVCGEILEDSLWISHVADQHKYLAWKEGDTALDVNDEDAVRRHLKSINRKTGHLTCKDCGKKWKLVKKYLRHIKTCDQDDGRNGTLDPNEFCVDLESGGTCGVCQKAVAAGNWLQHTQRYHNYLAWREGEKPLDLTDFTKVNEHLYVISKKLNGLICNKCSLTRKYVKSYLTHIKNCTGTNANLESLLPDDTPGGSYQCAMCKKNIEPAQWKQHAMKEHYNITWRVGQTPIDVKNPYAVERYLKEYKSKYGLKCKCGASRVSCAGFYAHIITCGKSEEEIEMFKSICEICNNSYLCIYKNQHMAIHRVQELNKELKLKKLEAKKEEERKAEEIVILPRKRQAAQKAQSVIENYSNDSGQSNFKCESCGIGAEFREDMKAHKCEANKEAVLSSESSSAEDPSGDESRESSADSDASADAERDDARKRHKSSATTPKVPRLPFQVTNRTAYLRQADEDFCNTHFTNDNLFPQWHSSEHAMVSECDLSRYFPPIEQSCKFKTASDWITLKRFEAVTDNGYALFTGACIVSIAWIPPRLDEISSVTNNYLAVVCHNGADQPRYLCDQTPSHENLIQIWQFNTFMRQTLPKIVFGIAHDFGTVWSMDWCPSGARDLLPEDPDPDRGQTYRLGLLAVACSNGSAYIFSVPYPSTIVQNDMFIHKLKPVAELRMTTSSTRKLYQATSITWSKEKSHKSVLVGYSDGSTAYYDLTCDSPMLHVVEKDIDVFFPYHDERPHNSSITATDMYPSALSEHGVAVAAGVTGTELGAARRGADGARTRVRVSAAAAAFAPHWPAAVLAGDVAVMNMVVTELEVGGAGRRLGGVRAAAGCARCGAVLAAAPPALCLLRAHPVYPDLKRRVVGMLELTRLDNKRQKRMNDELGIQIEPLTYADTVQKYGIEFKTVREADKKVQRLCTSNSRAHCPDRFPLADIKAMAFCPSGQYHNQLALATHSGLIFLMNVAS